MFKWLFRLGMAYAVARITARVTGSAQADDRDLPRNRRRPG
jgi:hypothetical protein